jgi:hypothetical protein
LHYRDRLGHPDGFVPITTIDMFIALAFCFLLLVIASAAHFARRRALRRLQESRVIATSRGPVEYAAIGSGPAVLLLHGGAGIRAWAWVFRCSRPLPKVLDMTAH